MRLNWHYLLLALCLLGIEVGIALFAHDRFIRPFVGDVLVVILVYTLLHGLLAAHWKKLLLAALLFCYAVEIGQYFNIVHWLGLQQNSVARVSIGSVFDWQDILAYTLGALLVYGVEQHFYTREK